MTRKFLGISIIPTADRGKATVKVRSGLDQKDPRLLPDMGVRVSFLAKQAPEGARPPAPGVLVGVFEETGVTAAGAINAISYLHTDGADTAHADPGAPFAGVPYFIKDLHAPVAGIPLRHGSRLFESNVHDFDSETVARLRRDGFLILGRTASPEFGMGASTEAELTGPTRNPWSLEHTAGGSSGGAGAAVASGICSIGHGNDIGGSIRIPATCCGRA